MFVLMFLLSLAHADVVFGPDVMEDGTPCWAVASAEEVGLVLSPSEDVTLTSFDYYQNLSEGSDHIRTIRLYDRAEVVADYALSPVAAPLYEILVDLAPSLVPGMVTVDVEWPLEAGKTYHMVHPEPYRTAHLGSTLCGLVDGEVVYPHSSAVLTVPIGVLHRFEGVSWTTTEWWNSFWNLTTELGLAVPTDADEDGVFEATDCDDTDPMLGSIFDDGDCDGIVTADDCDDDDETSTTLAEDGDCDGIVTADDCDDMDGASTTLAEDGDCDGVVTADDCDDMDNASTTVAEDADCDGVLTADDCDDADNASTTVVEDADCDGVVDADADGAGSTGSGDDTDGTVGSEKGGSSGGCTTVQSSTPRHAAPWAFALLALTAFRRERD